MLVCLAFCARDKAAAERLAGWIAELGGVKGHDCLLAVHRDTDSSGIIETLAGAFGRVAEFAVTDDMISGVERYAYCANIMWKRTLQHVAYMNESQPWLWIEPDAVPLVQGWVDSLTMEYARAGKPFLLDRVMTASGGVHNSGVGIYPAKVWNHTSRLHELGNDAWDVFFAADFTPHTHHGPLIHDNVAMRPDPRFDTAQSLAIIRPGAVLFHRDKSGQLIERLREKLRGLPSPVAARRPAAKDVQNLRTIYTYNEAIGDRFSDPELVALSIESFRRHGFNMVVLDERDAMRHPLYEKLSTHPALYDKQLPTPYLRACYRRWMAVAVQSKGDIKHQPVMVDWDVINYGFTPDMLPPATGTMKMLNVMAVPGMMIGTCDAYETMVQAFSDYADNPVPLAKGHVHDQNIVEMRSDLWTGVKLMVEYPSEGWETAKLVHYPHARLPFPGERGAKIKELRNPESTRKPCPMDAVFSQSDRDALLARIAALEAQLSSVAASVPAKSGNGVVVPSLTPPRRTPSKKPVKKRGPMRPELREAMLARMAALRARKAA